MRKDRSRIQEHSKHSDVRQWVKIMNASQLCLHTTKVFYWNIKSLKKIGASFWTLVFHNTSSSHCNFDCNVCETLKHMMLCLLPLSGAKEVNASGKTFTVKSSLQLLVNRHDDGVAYTCRVDHVSLTATHEETTQVLEVHCEYSWVLTQTNIPWWLKS